ADQAHREFAQAPALADARVENGGFLARVRTDDEQSIGLLDAGDAGVEQVGGAAEGRIERGAVLAAIDMGAAEPRHQILEGENLSRSREVADDGADARGRHRLALAGNRRERDRPRRRAQTPVFTDVRRVEALGAQAVDDLARLVRYP